VGKKRAKDLSENDTKEMIKEYWDGLCGGTDSRSDGSKEQRAIRKQYEKGSITTKGALSPSGMNSKQRLGGNHES